jgi:hypothetical protein
MWISFSPAASLYSEHPEVGAFVERQESPPEAPSHTRPNPYKR